jgi:multiple sugar transport system permease protein
MVAGMGAVRGRFIWCRPISCGRRVSIPGAPRLWPETWTIGNYESLLGTTPYWTWLRNSSIVALITVVLTVPLAVAAAYSVYRTRYRGRNVLALAVLAVYIFPTALLVVPIFGMFNQLGLLDSHVGLAIMYTALAVPFSVWLLQAFLRYLPNELEEAAAVDGAGRLRTIVQIVIPQMAPGIFAVAVFAVVVAWTDFLFASVLLLDDAKKTLAVGMADVIAQYRVQWGRLMAGAVMTAAPVVVLFTLTAKWFLRGISAGAVD